MTVIRATVAGLVVLAVWLLAAPPAGGGAPALARLVIGATCALPLAVLAATGLRGVRQWGAWVAIVLVPYFALSVGTLLVDPARRLESIAFSSLVATVFFLGIAANRRRG